MKSVIDSMPLFFSFSLLVPTLFKERVHSEVKICDRIKLYLNVVPLAFFFFQHQFRPQNITSRTCIITSGDLHYHFQGPALLLQRACIFSSGTCIIASGPALSLPGPALSLPGPALLLPDLHYFTVTFPS